MYKLILILDKIVLIIRTLPLQFEHWFTSLDLVKALDLQDRKQLLPRAIINKFVWSYDMVYLRGLIYK